MANKPKISIIIPVYNVEKYLEQCLKSVINQTFKDIEIICINDGSTDNSLEILEAFQKQDERIKIINKQNEGQGIARNEGLKIAKGEYISFIDPDDWVEQGMYEFLYNKFLETNAQIIRFNYRSFDEENKFQINPTILELSRQVILSLIFKIIQFIIGKMLKIWILKKWSCKFGTEFFLINLLKKTICILRPLNILKITSLQYLHFFLQIKFYMLKKFFIIIGFATILP